MPRTADGKPDLSGTRNAFVLQQPTPDRADRRSGDDPQRDGARCSGYPHEFRAPLS
jgi:hypothetical protein